MKRSAVLACFVSVFATACSQPVAPPDAATDVTTSPDAVTEDAPVDTATPPRDVFVQPPLTYTPAGCTHTVTTAPGFMTFMNGMTSNARMGDESTFGAMPAPRNVHTSWSADPSSTITVVWSTDADTLATVVEYGTDMGNLTQRAIGHRMTASSRDNAVHVHEVHICGLTPDTTYYYRVGGTGNFSDVQRFHTAPAAGQSTYDVNFVVSGDSRDDFGILENLQDRMLALPAMSVPDFQIFTGDAVAFGTVQASWDDWFQHTRATMRAMPWISVHGNHEALSVNYVAQFAQPQDNGELYFSLNYGPLHIVVLNDSPPGGNYDGIINGTERTWLENDLRTVDRARTPWVIVTHHKSPYSSSTHAGDADIARITAAWVPLYEQYNVDLVLNGHDHDFEITHPLRNGMPVAAGERGTVYVVTGGAGAEPYGARTTARTQHSVSVNHFVHVHATERALELTPYDAAGAVIEQGRATITRP